MDLYKTIGHYARVLTAFKHGQEATIHEIALRLNASYGWTHGTCRYMIRSGLLHARHIGPSIACAPNPKHRLFPLLTSINDMLKKFRE